MLRRSYSSPARRQDVLVEEEDLSRVHERAQSVGRYAIKLKARNPACSCASQRVDSAPSVLRTLQSGLLARLQQLAHQSVVELRTGDIIL